MGPDRDRDNGLEEQMRPSAVHALRAAEDWRATLSVREDGCADELCERTVYVDELYMR